MVQWVKDPMVSLQWLGSMLWPRNFQMLKESPKKEKKEKR